MIHHVFACKSNIGDWLSAKGIQTLLSPLPVTEYLCDDPFVAGTLGRLSKLGPNDLIVIGGGGLFMDYFAPFWEGFRQIGERVPFCLWGVGYCDTKNAASRCSPTLLEEIVGDSRLCIVRDELTRAYLLNCSLPPPVQCPTMAIVRPPEREGSSGLLHVVHYDVVGARTYEQIDSCARQLALSTGRGYRETDNQIEDGSETQLAGLLGRYAEADLIVSSRLHGCIIGVAMGRKVLAVSGDRKVESFMESVGLREWVCEQDDLELLGERLALLPSQPIPTTSIERVRQDNRGIAERIRRIANDLAP